MFTGIVEELGQVKQIANRGGLMRLEIGAQEVLAQTKIGDSIAVNGVCLTVVAITGQSVTFEVMEATRKNTNLGLLKINSAVHLERSLKVGDRVSGHFVSGHIDCQGLIRKKILRNGTLELEIALPPEFMRYCLPKGSIALDGISLTLAKAQAGKISVHIIPHTLKNTILNSKGPSDKLNIEFDLLAKKNSL